MIHLVLDSFGAILFAFNGQAQAETVAASRIDHSVQSIEVSKTIPQCQESQQTGKSSRLHCLRPEGHYGEHQFGKPMTTFKRKP